MKKAVLIVSGFIFVSLLFVVYVKGASYWKGNNVYDEDTIKYGVTKDKYWNVSPESITKVSNPGNTYKFTDITEYSAYVSNNVEYIGNYITESFYWYNFSRLLYVKLFKVTPGQYISFVFSNSYYAYCAEFNSDFYLVDDGTWITTGEKIKLESTTNWIMVVFRQDNGNSENGSGTDTEITSEEIQNQANKYIVFSPFTYTFNPNGAIYMGSTDNFVLTRLGVEKITLPTLSKYGYSFMGWKSASGNVYSSTLDKTYNSDLFKNQTFTAQWQQILVSSVDIVESSLDIDLTVTNTYKLTANVLPDNALNKNVKWTVSDSAIAAVDQSGNVTGLSTGSCYVYATATDGSGVYDKCLINVIQSDVSVDFNDSSVVMEPGETFTPLKSINAITGAVYTINYSSDTPETASVDNEGVITAHSEGIATISVVSSTGSTDQIVVYVMSYNVIIPALIEKDKSFEIKIEVNNNGNTESLNRRTLQVMLDNLTSLKRIGDSSTEYALQLYKSYDQKNNLNKKESLIETEESISEEFIIKTASPIIEPGDYSGYIQFGINLFY